jgi:hypothetical protein
MPVVIGAVAFLAVVGLLIWGRSSSATKPATPVVTTPGPVTSPDKPPQPAPTPVTPPGNTLVDTPLPVAPNPAIPNPAITPEPVKPPDDGKGVAQVDPPKPRPRPSGNVPGKAEMIDNINRLERDLEARLAAGQKISSADRARQQLTQMRAETRKAKNAEDLRKVEEMLDFLEKNLLKRQ